MKFPPPQIGSLRIASPAIQAALSGYSDWAERQMVRRLGAASTLSEVMLDQFIVTVTKGKKAKRYLRVDENDHPVGAQLMGCEPEEFATAAQKVLEWGFDWVDINFGCPVKKILGRRRGGFHLSQPDMAIAILRRVRDIVPDSIPVTLKMRRGLDDSEESREKFFQIFDAAREIGIRMFTIHPRTVLQRYVGPSDWNFLTMLRRYAPDVTIFGSGDLFTAQDGMNMLEATGIDGLTFARGAIGNPWIFREFDALNAGLPCPAPPDLREQREVITEHFSLAAELYGARRSLFIMKKFCVKYARLHPEMEAVRAAFLAIKTPDDRDCVLEKWYG
ncbi:MAG: tRNA-dihydrouridine synthase [Planctomycetia bacterium]|nr:tRNA-dihydrouridine synthase [Planctomycetia bacterium]